MTSTSAEYRQSQACGLLPPIANARGRMPESNLSRLGFKGFADAKANDGACPTYCPTYTTSLPEVIEIARASRWKENLEAFVGGPPSELLVNLIDIYEGEAARFERWAMTPNKDGGGADTRRGA